MVYKTKKVHYCFMDQILRTLFYEWQDRKLPELVPRQTEINVSKHHGVNNATVITGFLDSIIPFIIIEMIVIMR